MAFFLKFFKKSRYSIWQARRRFAAGNERQLCAGEHITASLATLPERKESLEIAVSSILDWAGQVNVFLNGWVEAVPQFLKDDRIHVHISRDNIGDRGKFHWVDKVRDGYHFICDDDLYYSTEYAELLIERIERYDRAVIVGAHGSILVNEFRDFYSNDRLIKSFHESKANDFQVDFLGTGIIAFHAASIRLPYAIFEQANMADVFLGVHARRKGIPLICCESEGDLVKNATESQQASIYEHCMKDIIGSEFNVRSAVNQYLSLHWHS